MYRLAARNLLTVALLMAANSMGLATPLGGRTDVALAPLPGEREGHYPLQLPGYSGQVKQLELINDRWVILALYDLPEVMAKVDALSGGQLLKADRDWKTSEAAGRPNWTAYTLPAKLHKQFLSQAREELGERKLEVPAAYAIASSDDRAYAKPQAPLRVTCTFVSLGGHRVPGSHEVDYARYCILEFPQPMRPGNHYSIRVGDRGETSFSYDEMNLVSRAIKVNQAGYRPDASVKMAYLGACGYELGPIPFDQAKEFKIVDVQTGKAVFTGPVRLRERDPHFAPKPKQPETESRPSMYGEDVYELDFSGLRAEGDFFITVPGVGRSWTFRHAPDAYGEAFYTAARLFFHQRAATALESANTAWTRPKSLMHDKIYEGNYLAFPQQTGGPKNLAIFDAVGANTDLTRFTTNVIGGWYDAADWDRNQAHYVAVFDMLRAFEAAPGSFTDGQLNLPESGDGVPDLLNEVAWGLECWRRSQDERGGVSGFIETSTHSAYNDTNYPYAFSMRTRWSSLIYAAAAAQYARLVKPYNAGQSALYRDSALRAWAFGVNPSNSLGKITLQAKDQRGKGKPYSAEWEETDKIVAPYRVQAALQMNRLTGDPSYLEGIDTLANLGTGPFQWSFSHRDFSAWIYADLALNPDKRLPAALVATWRAKYLNEADNLVAQMATMPYRQTWPRYMDYWAGWGASTVVNFNRCLFIAWQLTGDAKYRDAMILNTDFMLGANPMGMSWTTGIGYVYPIDIQHHNSETDGIMDPVPGITIYGLNGGQAMHYKGREYIWEGKGADGKPISFIKEANKKVPFYRCWSAHPHVNVGQCEFTIHETCSAMMFSTAVLLEKGWKPGEALKKRGPRQEQYLFGYWPLP